MRIRRLGLFSGGACLMLSCMFARLANATIAPQSYEVTVDGGSVEVCIGPADYSLCDSLMLREDADGAVADLPGTVTGNFGTCYVDECVPPGTYRYGCETPLGCKRPYWVSATVTDPQDGGCVRRVKDSAPIPVSGPPPWPANTESPSCPQSGCGIGFTTAGSAFASYGPALLGSLVPLLLVGRWRRRRRHADSPAAPLAGRLTVCRKRGAR